MLVGGVDPDTGEATNQLWVLNEQCHWTMQPLLPTKTECYNASAVNIGDHFIVTGGCSGDVGSPLKWRCMMATSGGRSSLFPEHVLL